MKMGKNRGLAVGAEKGFKWLSRLYGGLSVKNQQS